MTSTIGTGTDMATTVILANAKGNPRGSSYAQGERRRRRH